MPESSTLHRPNSVLVSILMPSLNQARFLLAALDSVLQQSHTDIEVVVADGGSEDGSVEVLRNYTENDPRVRWFSKKDSGPANAVNSALAAARGDTIGWLNADDEYAPGAVELAVRQFAANPELAMLYGHGDFINERGNTIAPYPTKRPDTPMEEFAKGCFVCQPSVFIRREAWQELGNLDESLATAFDFELWLRAFRRWPGRIGFVDRVLARSRQHPETITAQKRKQVALEGVAVLRRHLGQTPPEWILTHLEEIMADHPDTSGKQLPLKVQEVIEEARNIMLPEDFANLHRRVADDRRLVLAGPNSYVGVYADGWAGDVLHVRHNTKRATRLTLTCRSGLPRFRRHNLQVTGPDGQSFNVTTRGGRTFELELPAVPGDSGNIAKFAIQSRETFCPAQSDARSNDTRHLSFQVINVCEIF